MPAPEHKILPEHRLTETRHVHTPRGQTAHISVGYDPDTPLAPAEVRYSGGLDHGSDLEYHLRDVCILVSLLLQLGMPPSEISRSLSRQGTAKGEQVYASLAGWVLGAVYAPPSWAEDVIRKEALERCHLWPAPDVMVQFLRSGDPDLREAALAAAWKVHGTLLQDSAETLLALEFDTDARNQAEDAQTAAKHALETIKLAAELPDAAASVS